MADRANTNNRKAAVIFAIQKTSGCWEKWEVRAANLAWVLNDEGTTLKYHHVNITVADNESRATFPKKFRASLRKPLSLLVKRRNATENTVPSAKAIPILNSS